jgi:type I restriction enzyme, S subunit
LLEGLEITIKNLNELYDNNPTYRLDSEFYKKEYFLLYKELFKKSCIKLESVSSWVTQGPNPKFTEIGIPCLTGRNINKGRVNYINADFISENEYENLKRFQLKIGDTLITLKGKGSIGKIGYVTDKRRAIFSRDIGVIRPNKINPAFLNAFILSRFGTKIIARGETGGTGQSTLTASYLKNIDIPKLEIEREIGELIISSEKILSNSQGKYNLAESILLQEIGLQNFERSQDPINIKSFKESFGVTKRLDAEYYQKKYEQIIEIIRAQNHNSLIELVEISKSIEPGTEHYSDGDGLPFYRVSDYNKFGLSKPVKELKNSFVTDNKNLIKKLIPEKGTILFSKDGSVGTAYLLRHDLNGITSSAILHLQVKNTKEILPEYLTLVLNSKLVQMQAERDAGGSIILHWRKEEIEQVVVPIVDFKIQKEIAKLVEESFKLRKESERLLEVGKRAVEFAIEKSEEFAIEFIKREVKREASKII